MYPRLNIYVTIKSKEGSYFLINHADGEEYRISVYLAEFLMKLDGKTDPYSISPIDYSGTKKLLRDLLHDGVLRTGCSTKVERYDCNTWYTVRGTRVERAVACLVNFILLFFAMPTLAIGFYMVHRFVDVSSDVSSYGFAGIFLGQILGVLPAFFLHELGHFCAALSYRVPVYELGIIDNVLGAYTLINEAALREKGRFVSFQVDAAGLEMNALLAGASYMSSVYAPVGFQPLLIGMGLVNITLTILNLLPTDWELDGSQMLCALLQSDTLMEDVRLAALKSNLKGILFQERRGKIHYALILLLAGLQKTPVKTAIYLGIGAIIELPLLW